jgi:hypothetical protein
LLELPLQSLERSQVKEYVEDHLKDRRVVEIETTEAIAARFQKWAKLFLAPATILLFLFWGSFWPWSALAIIPIFARRFIG